MTEIRKLIQKIGRANSGIFTTKQIEEAGISRVYLKTFTDDSSIVRIGQGRYALPDAITDDYALLQLRSHVLLFSHGTALYFWGMSDRIPHIIDVTVPSGTNVSRIKKDHSDVRFHYIKSDLYGLGVAETVSPMGNSIRLYDKERCICDLIRGRKHTDMQLYSQAIKEYFSNQPNMRKVLKYGRLFGIEDKIRTYSEVLA